MRLPNFHFGRLAALSGFLTSAAIGCVVTFGDGGKEAESCPDVNSELSEGKCFCDPGYDWCDENDQANLSCCPNATSNTNTDPTNGPTNGTTTNGEGTTTNEPTSGTTAEIPTTTEDPTSGTTGEPLECTVDQDPPGSCGEGEDFLCIQASDPLCDTEGSKYYVCTNGMWVETPAAIDENCISDGYDFGVGCEDNGSMVVFDCGVGPGTPCQTGSPATCNGETLYEECYNGKLTSTDCEAYCMEIGDGMGVTYDYGFCGEQREEIVCLCCDEGDEGCPINEDTTGEGTSTGGGESTGGSTGG